MPPEWSAWWDAQPRVTRWVGVASVAVPLACAFVPRAVSLCVWHWPHVRGLQVWRCVSSLFVARLDFGLLMAVYMRVRFLALLEASPAYSGAPSDLVWALVVISLLLNAANVLLGRAVLWDGLTLAVVHVWSRLHASERVSFLFGLRIPAAYVSPALAGVCLLTSGDVLLPLAGLLAGHAYYVAAFVRGPLGPRVFAAPGWLRAALDGGRPAVSVPPGPAAPRPAAPSGFRAFSGAGNRLGKE